MAPSPDELSACRDSKGRRSELWRAEPAHSNLKHVLGHARSPCVPTERPHGRHHPGHERAILRICTGIVSQPWGSLKGAAGAGRGRACAVRSRLPPISAESGAFMGSLREHPSPTWVEGAVGALAKSNDISSFVADAVGREPEAVRASV